MRIRTIIYFSFCLLPYLVLMMGVLHTTYQPEFWDFGIIYYIFLASGLGIPNSLMGLVLLTQPRRLPRLDRRIIILGTVIGGILPTLLFVIGLIQLSF